MKKTFVQQIVEQVQPGQTVTLLGWIKSVRRHGGVTFLDICDSTGFIQCVASRTRLGAEPFALINSVTAKSAVEVTGALKTVNRGSASVSAQSQSHRHYAIPGLALDYSA